MVTGAIGKELKNLSFSSGETLEHTAISTFNQPPSGGLFYAKEYGLVSHAASRKEEEMKKDAVSHA